METTTTQDATAENILDHLSDVAGHPHESLVPYREFSEAGKTYYFTPGGFLYRKDFLAEQIGGVLLWLPHQRGVALQNKG